MHEKDIMSPLNDIQLSMMQSEHPDVIINTIDEKSLSDSKKIYEENNHIEQLFPSSQEEISLFASEMKSLRNQYDIRDKIESSSIKSIIAYWLKHLGTATRKNYSYYMTDMIRRNIIPACNDSGNIFTGGDFRCVAHETVIDQIKQIEEWSESTRQVHAACYISFTTFLERKTHGWFRKALPSKLASNKTFFQVRDKCKTKALSMHEWDMFIQTLHKINLRDALIAKCALQGAKRISEVLTVTLDQIDFQKNIINFKQSKTGGTDKKIPITYPSHFMQELRWYIDSTNAFRNSSCVFVTRNGKPLTRARCNYIFAQASEKAGLSKVTPHVLRATWVTLAKSQGVQDTEIMKVTGHTSSKMIYAYDKNSAEDNYSKKLVLV